MVSDTAWIPAEQSSGTSLIWGGEGFDDNEVYQGIGGKGNGTITNGATYRIRFDWIINASERTSDGLIRVWFGQTSVGGPTVYGNERFQGVYTNTEVWDTSGGPYEPPTGGTNLLFGFDDYGEQRGGSCWNIQLEYVSPPAMPRMMKPEKKGLWNWLKGLF
jgi:hypothetical protein